MADILISHVKEDSGRVQELAKLLAASGWTIWWNGEIAPGAAVDMATEFELEQASVVITIWSKHSIQSRLVRNTAFEAIESHRWLPLLLDYVRPPLRYRHYRSIEMVGWPDKDSPEVERYLLESCNTLLAGNAIATPSNDKQKPPIDQTLVTNGLSAKSALDSIQAPKFATIQLSEWTIEEGQNRICRGHQVKKVTPRSMQVLMYLVENGRTPTSIERILSHVWRDRIVVESVVHRCISELREALDDDFREPKYIETIAKRGYRIVAPISELDVTADI